ncbi:uncharacterized protein LOC119743384 [Patiria miniata]|uniref:Uncharacterized protein n=1 Tax=Patiria miniata TaxID=46514 RepID=A0A914BJS6_PATMI|nr:uncharacterized protein LOC119743384 [Patiria miniata]
MGRVVKPVVIVEVIVLVAAFAAGLTVIIPLLETENELPKIKCLPYSQIEFSDHNPPHYWLTDVEVQPPESNGPCDYCLFSQITVVVAALASILYRLVTLCGEKYDLSFLRTMSVPLYAMCTLGVLVEGIILQVGVNRFLGSAMVYKTYTDPKTCDQVQAGLQKAADKSSQDLSLNFCSELSIVTVASWISTFTWLSLTILAGVQFHLQRHAPQPSDRQMLVYGAGEDQKT